MADARSETTIDDERVRVTTWSFEKAGDSTGAHVHEYDYVLVPVTGGTLTAVSTTDGSARTITQVAGSPYTGRPARPHGDGRHRRDRFRRGRTQELIRRAPRRKRSGRNDSPRRPRPVPPVGRGAIRTPAGVIHPPGLSEPLRAESRWLPNPMAYLLEGHGTVEEADGWLIWTQGS